MIFFFGLRSRQLNSPNGDLEDCAYCETKESVGFFFFQRYFHIFWIPIIPLGKTGSSECSHCREVLFPKEMPDVLKQKFMEQKAVLRTPWGYKIILYLVFALIAIPFVLGLFHQLYSYIK